MRFPLGVLMVMAALSVSRLLAGDEPSPTSGVQAPEGVQAATKVPLTASGTARALLRPVSLHFDDAPLSGILQHIAREYSVNIVFDQTSPATAGVMLDTRVSIDVDGVQLKSALSLLLKPLGLDHRQEDRAVVITDRRARRATRIVIWDARDADVFQALNRPISLQFNETPLTKVLQHIAHTHDISLVADVHGLNAEGVREDQPVTIHVDGVKLETALKLILEPLQLGASVEPQVIKITGRSRLGEPTVEAVHPSSPREPGRRMSGKAGYAAGAIID